MSAKLKSGTQIFPTVCKDGTIKILLGSYEIPIVIPYDEDFPYDNSTYIRHSNILCYLENDKHKLVIRQDGSLTRYTRDNVVIGNIHITLPEILNDIEVLVKGTFLHSEQTILNECYFLPDKKTILLSSHLFHGFFEVPMNFNREFIDRLNFPLKFEPVLDLIKETKGNTSEYSIAMCNKNLNPVYPIIAEYISMIRDTSIR